MISTPTCARFASLWLCLFMASGAVSAPAPMPDVAATGNISSHSIRDNELLQFTITIKNRADAKTGQAIHGITLWRLPDSYALDDSDPICVVPVAPPRTNSCESVQAFRDSRNLIADTLGPGESLTVQGYLKPTTVHKTATLTAVITWSVAGDGKPPVAVSSAQWINLGDNQVQSEASAEWAWAYEFVIKVLAIPVTLALVGFILELISKRREADRAATERDLQNRRADDDRKLQDQRADAERDLQNQRHDAERQRDEQREDAERQREELRQDLQKQQALRAETWKQMLPISHQYAAKFYLPLSLAAERLADALEASNSRLAFFYVLFSGKKMIATRDEIGGFYFKDLHGETLAAECWKAFRLACLGDEDNPHYLAVRAAIQRLEEIDNYESFLAEFADDSAPNAGFVDDDVQRAWELFQQWLAKSTAVKEVIRYLRGFTAVLDFESNRAYAYWYDSPARLKITDEVQAPLQKMLEDEKYPTEEVKAYFSAVTRP